MQFIKVGDLFGGNRELWDSVGSVTNFERVEEIVACMM